MEEWVELNLYVYYINVYVLKVKAILCWGGGLSKSSMSWCWSCDVWQLCCHLCKLINKVILHNHICQVLTETKTMLRSIQTSQIRKKKLIIIIDLSLRKRQSWLQKVKLNYKFWEPKKKKKTKKTKTKTTTTTTTKKQFMVSSLFQVCLLESW